MRAVLLVAGGLQSADGTRAVVERVRQLGESPMQRGKKIGKNGGKKGNKLGKIGKRGKRKGRNGEK